MIVRRAEQITKTLFLYRLEFEDVEMGGPAMGECQNDTMMVRK